jgi:hypothetical protein
LQVGPRIADTARWPSIPGGIELPSAGNALQLVLATTLELNPRASDKIGHRSRDEDFICHRDSRHALAKVNRHAAYIPASQLDLARMQSSPYLNAE